MSRVPTIPYDPRDGHAIERARERYGLEINSITLRHIERRVREGEVGILCAWANGGILAEIEIGQDSPVVVRFVYRDGRVVTFLPRHETKHSWATHGYVWLRVNPRGKRFRK